MTRQTPEEMEALFTAFAEQHNAARLDPLAYERAEVERLVSSPQSLVQGK